MPCHAIQLSQVPGCHHEHHGHQQPDYTNKVPRRIPHHHHLHHHRCITTIIIKDSMNITSSREITSGWAKGRNPQNIFPAPASHHYIPIHINNNTISIIISISISFITISSCLISYVIITISTVMLSSSSLTLSPSLILLSTIFLRPDQLDVASTG